MAKKQYSSGFSRGDSVIYWQGTADSPQRGQVVSVGQDGAITIVREFNRREITVRPAFLRMDRPAAWDSVNESWREFFRLRLEELESESSRVQILRSMAGR